MLEKSRAFGILLKFKILTLLLITRVEGNKFRVSENLLGDAIPEKRIYFFKRKNISNTIQVHFNR